MRQIHRAYDLIKDKDYTKLINKLKTMGATKELLSTWSLSTEMTAKQVLDELRSYHDTDDKLRTYEYVDKSVYPSWFSGDFVSQFLAASGRKKESGLSSLLQQALNSKR